MYGESIMVESKLLSINKIFTNKLKLSTEELSSILL